MSLIQMDMAPTIGKLRQFGACGLLALTILGFWVNGLDGETARGVAIGLWAGAGLLGLLAAFAPAPLRYPWLALSIVTWPIGFVVSQIILFSIFYGLITPFGLFFRLIGRDTMRRRCDPEAATYWAERERVTDRTRYYRQF